MENELILWNWYCENGDDGGWEKSTWTMVDTDRFDIVEKKASKIQRLEEELNCKFKFKEHYQKLIDNYTLRAIEISEDIEKIKAELKELEE